MIEVTESAARHLLGLLEEKEYSPAEKGLRLLVECGTELRLWDFVRACKSRGRTGL